MKVNWYKTEKYIVVTYKNHVSYELLEKFNFENSSEDDFKKAFLDENVYIDETINDQVIIKIDVEYGFNRESNGGPWKQYIFILDPEYKLYDRIAVLEEKINKLVKDLK